MHFIELYCIQFNSTLSCTIQFDFILLYLILYYIVYILYNGI
nr:MAG TPA: hypothetical protein [Caudoviricetes sp.]